MFIWTKHRVNKRHVLALMAWLASRTNCKNWRWSPFTHATWKDFQPQLAKDFKLPAMGKGQIIPHPCFLHCPYPPFLLCQPWFSPIEPFRKWCQCSNSSFDVTHILSETSEIEKGSWQSGCQGYRIRCDVTLAEALNLHTCGAEPFQWPCWRQTKPEIKATIWAFIPLQNISPPFPSWWHWLRVPGVSRSTSEPWFLPPDREIYLRALILKLRTVELWEVPEVTEGIW